MCEEFCLHKMIRKRHIFQMMKYLEIYHLQLVFSFMVIMIILLVMNRKGVVLLVDSLIIKACLGSPCRHDANNSNMINAMTC